MLIRHCYNPLLHTLRADTSFRLNASCRIGSSLVSIGVMALQAGGQSAYSKRYRGARGTVKTAESSVPTSGGRQEERAGTTILLSDEACLCTLAWTERLYYISWVFG